VVHLPQPQDALTAAAAIIPHSNGNASDLWRLGATHSVTTLTGFGADRAGAALGQLSVADAWAAAHVDEDWNMAQWGRDELALERRAYREAEMQAAGACSLCCARAAESGAVVSLLTLCYSLLLFATWLLLRRRA